MQIVPNVWPHRGWKLRLLGWYLRFRKARRMRKGLYYVTDFGARADGVTDDAVAFDAAIGAMPGTGGSVPVPPGVMKVGHSVMVGRSASPGESLEDVLKRIDTYDLDPEERESISRVIERHFGRTR